LSGAARKYASTQAAVPSELLQICLSTTLSAFESSIVKLAGARGEYSIPPAGYVFGIDEYFPISASLNVIISSVIHSLSVQY